MLCLCSTNFVSKARIFFSRCPRSDVRCRLRHIPLRNVVQYHCRRDGCRYRIWSAIFRLCTGHYQSLCDARWLWALSTELFDDIGAGLAERGHEFGSTTGRPRRCGWFDAVALRQAVQVNSISGLCLTKLDVLDGLIPLKFVSATRMAASKTAGRILVVNFTKGSRRLRRSTGLEREYSGDSRCADLPPRRRTTFAWLKKRWVHRWISFRPGQTEMRRLCSTIRSMAHEVSDGFKTA